ncbi:MAG: PrsW family glutamic-type intramembrane protease [Candidatus Pacebacteria bacterium]|nr:PrsW family glutamic-type intramembrane protease [Candidatus Paceibacterota bacterium]
MAILTIDPKTLLIAFFGGIIPSLLWLWFWLKEDEEHPEPKGLVTIIFIMGMIAVILVLPIQKFIQDNVGSYEGKLILWASVEEILKYLAVLIILCKTNNASKPIDWPIYIITAALGFAALENMLFLLKIFPASIGTTQSLSTGNLRFLGANLLHAISSGIVGISIGISFYAKKWEKNISLFVGFLIAIALHTAFNFFIIRNDGNDSLKVLTFLWVVTIIIMLLFEKVRRMSKNY